MRPDVRHSNHSRDWEGRLFARPLHKNAHRGQNATAAAQGRHAEQIRTAPAKVIHAAQMSTALAALRKDETQRRRARPLRKRCQTRADPRPLCEEAQREQIGTALGCPLAAMQSLLRILSGHKFLGGCLAPARRHTPHTGSQTPRRRVHYIRNHAALFFFLRKTRRWGWGSILASSSWLRPSQGTRSRHSGASP